MIMKFIVEENLGKLAKKLRALGYDVEVVKSINIDAIITIAIRQKRIILTRNKSFAKMNKMFSRRLIISDNPIIQLAEIKDLISFSEENFMSRCLVCNSKLIQVDKAQVTTKLPEKIYEKYSQYKYCPKCRKYYWEGSHFHNMKAHLKNL